MAAVSPSLSNDQAIPVADEPAPALSHERRKRKIGSDDDDDKSPPPDGCPKQPRRDDPHDAVPSRSPERRKSATQEEKKRGRRLFGGVLSTLSQTPSQSSQHSRRQEIEQRQKERMQSQDSEAAQRRAQKLERLHSVRMAEQIVFEEQVLANKHSKMLSLARFLRTKAEPPIYYLPWKRTEEQQRILEAQMRNAKETIKRGSEELSTGKERHAQRHPTKTGSNQETRNKGLGPTAPAGVGAAAATQPQPPVAASKAAEAEVQDGAKDQHDESGDYLVEAEEDTVIY